MINGATWLKHHWEPKASVINQEGHRQQHRNTQLGRSAYTASAKKCTYKKIFSVQKYHLEQCGILDPDWSEGLDLICPIKGVLLSQDLDINLRPSVHPSVRPFICPYIHYRYQYIKLGVFIFIHPSIPPSIHLSIHYLIPLSIYPSIHLPITNISKKVGVFGHRKLTSFYPYIPPFIHHQYFRKSVFFLFTAINPSIPSFIYSSIHPYINTYIHTSIGNWSQSQLTLCKNPGTFWAVRSQHRDKQQFLIQSGQLTSSAGLWAVKANLPPIIPNVNTLSETLRCLAQPTTLVFTTVSMFILVVQIYSWFSFQTKRPRRSEEVLYQ